MWEYFVIQHITKFEVLFNSLEAPGVWQRELFRIGHVQKNNKDNLKVMRTPIKIIIEHSVESIFAIDEILKTQVEK